MVVHRTVSCSGPGQAARGKPGEVGAQGVEALRPEGGDPGGDRVGGRRVGGAGAGPAAFGEHDQPGAGVVRVGVACHVALADQFLHQLAGRLLGEAQVLGQFADGRAAGGQPGEGEAVRRADVVEAPGRAPGLDPGDELAGEGEQQGRQGAGVGGAVHGGGGVHGASVARKGKRLD